MAFWGAEPVVVREWEIIPRRWPVALDGLRLAHVSDLHFTRWTRTLRHARHLLETLSYDLLLVTGDFGNFHRYWPHAAKMTRDFFAGIADKVASYAVLGNHDHPKLAFAEGFPLRLLRNQVDQFSIRGCSFNIAGIEQTMPRGGDLRGTLAQVADSMPTVLLAHYPSTAYHLDSEKVQLVLSGHTHGGQIRLPWLGCIWPNDRVPRKMACGLHVVNDIHVHVSAGLGVSLPLRVRINCPPEIAILTMRSGGSD